MIAIHVFIYNSVMLFPKLPDIEQNESDDDAVEERGKVFTNL